MATASRDSLVSSVFARLGESAGFYTEEEAERAVLAALAELNLISGCFRGSAAILLSPDKVFYPTPHPVIFPMAVEVSGKRLVRCQFSSLMVMNRTWYEMTGNWPSVWCPVGWTRIAILPRIGVLNVEARVEGIVSPPDSLTHPVVLPDEMVEIVVELAWHRMVMREGGPLFSDATSSMQEVSRRIREILAWKQAKIQRYRSLVSVSPDS